MENIILWAAFLISIVLLFLSLRKPYAKEIIFLFLLTAYVATFLGVLVVEEQLLDYPVQFLDFHFDSNILYEYLVLPVICIYYYQSTYDSGYPGIFLQGVLYTTVLTIIEVLFEQYTDLIVYLNWSWIHTFLGILALMLFVRIFMKVIYVKLKEST